MITIKRIENSDRKMLINIKSGKLRETKLKIKRKKNELMKIENLMKIGKIIRNGKKIKEEMKVLRKFKTKEREI